MATLLTEIHPEAALARPTDGRVSGLAWLPRFLWHDLTAPLVVLFVCILPWCANFLLIYPDERFYLDAALTMHETRDLLVPRYEDGSPRLNKPLLTYWIMLASFDLFGVHILAARLPFLLAAAGILVLTWRLAWLVSGQRRVAQLAVWIVLANPMFWLSAMRCLPDILLVLFATMAVYGYFALRARDWSHTPSAWWLALGLGLSFATKGLPALLLIGCIGLHALFDWRQFHGRMARTLMAPIAAGLALGLAGFMPILWNHAQETVQEMWHDQFAQRLVYQARDILHRLPLLLLSVAALHLAWIWPGVAGLRGSWRQRRPSSPWARFIVLTCVIWIAATVATENCSLRYLAPMFPWLAIVLADRVARCNVVFLDRYTLRMLRICAVALLGLTLIAMLIVVQLPGRWLGCASLVMIAVVVLGLVRQSKDIDSWRRLTAMGAIGPAAVLVTFIAVRPVVSPDLGTQVGQSVQQVPQGRGSVAVWGSACQASRVRLALTPLEREARRCDAPTTSAPLLLLPVERIERLSVEEFEFAPAAALTERLPWKNLARTAIRGDLATFLNAQRTNYCWALRKETQAASVARYEESREQSQ